LNVRSSDELDRLVEQSQQIIHLRGVLREALTATNDLVRSLKRQQKQQQAYKSAIASLRELQGVA
jgi:hypothetical protein